MSSLISLDNTASEMLAKLVSEFAVAKRVLCGQDADDARFPPAAENVQSVFQGAADVLLQFAFVCHGLRSFGFCRLHGFEVAAEVRKPLFVCVGDSRIEIL